MPPSAQTPLTIDSAREFIRQNCFTPWPRAVESIEPGLIGIELELYPYVVDGESLKPIEELDGLFDLFCQMPTSRIIKKADANAKKLFYASMDSLQFEPGGQTELITGPVNTLSELLNRITSLKQYVYKAGRALNTSFGQYAMQPWFTPDQIQLKIQNDRYQSMIDYFDSISPYGRRMMLESCSLQINIDLGYTEEQMVKRIGLANLLAPISTSLFANSPNYAGQSTPYHSYRYHVWQNLDSSRSGIPYAKDFGTQTSLSDLVESYLQMALKAPVIETSTGINSANHHVSFEEWMRDGIDGSFPYNEDLRRHLTYLFPDVRIRRFIELRSIDVPPEGWEFVPICFYCGLLYDETALDLALEVMLSRKGELNSYLQQSVFGLKSDEQFEVCKQIFSIATDGYHRLPARFKLKSDTIKDLEKFDAEFLSQRRTFADLLRN